MVKRYKHPPPTIVCQGSFVLLRLTNRANHTSVLGHRPLSSDYFMSRNSSRGQMNSSSLTTGDAHETTLPAQDPDASTTQSPIEYQRELWRSYQRERWAKADQGSVQIGLTPETIEQALEISALAYRLYLVGSGEENGAWWARTGRASTTQAALELLDVAERARAAAAEAREEQIYQVFGASEGGSDNESCTAMDPATAMQNDQDSQEMADVTAPNESRLRPSVCAPASADSKSLQSDRPTPNTTPTPVERASMAALVHEEARLTGHDWLGLARNEQRQRAMYEKYTRRDAARGTVPADQRQPVAPLPPTSLPQREAGAETRRRRLRPDRALWGDDDDSEV